MSLKHRQAQGTNHLSGRLVPEPNTTSVKKSFLTSSLNLTKSLFTDKQLKQFQFQYLNSYFTF